MTHKAYVVLEDDRLFTFVKAQATMWSLSWSWNMVTLLHWRKWWSSIAGLCSGQRIGSSCRSSVLWICAWTQSWHWCKSCCQEISKGSSRCGMPPFTRFKSQWPKRQGCVWGYRIQWNVWRVADSRRQFRAASFPSSSYLYQHVFSWIFEEVDGLRISTGVSPSYKADISHQRPNPWKTQRN